MAQHVWSVFCHKTLIDPQTKVVSLVDIIEKLTVEDAGVGQAVDSAIAAGKKGVALTFPTQLVSWWVRSSYTEPEDDLRIRVRLEDPSGDELLSQEIAVDLAEYNSQRVTLHLDNIPVTTLGNYWFIVEKASKRKAAPWISVATIPLEIAATQPSKI